MSGTLSPDASIEEIEDEIAFTAVLIDSLDAYVEDYQDRLHELSERKMQYESMLRDRTVASHAGHQQYQPHSSHGNHVTPNEHSSRLTGLHSLPNSEDSGSDLELDIQRNLSANSSTHSPAHSWDHLSLNKNTHRQQFGNPSPLGSTGMKRPLSQSLQRDDYLERIRRQEEAWRRQHEASQQDAVLAQTLSTQHSGSAPASSSSRPNNGGVQATLDYKGEFHRPPPPPPPRPVSYIKPESSSQASNMASHPVASQHAMRPVAYLPSQFHAQDSPMWSSSQASRVKNELYLDQRQQMVARPKPSAESSTNVIDLTSSDDDERLLSSATATKPVYAAPTTMQYVGGGMPSMQMPGAWPSITQQPNTYVYGNNYSTGVQAARQIPTFRTASHEMGNLLGYGSSTQPYDVDYDDDYDDDDDLVYGGSRSIRAYGQYANGREDLYRDRFDAFAAHDPTKSREEIQQLLENVRPDEEMPAHLRVQTPDDLTIKLHKYQELGVTWLQNCEKGSNKGGILADDMGLGKTVQMISLIVTHKSTDPRCKTTLIVAPVALMRQWKQEIANKIKPGRYKLTVFTHHGQSKAKDFRELQHYDIVLTTFGSLAAELKKQENFHKRKLADRDARPTPADKCVLLGEDANWYRVILDEAQCIKNRNTQTSKGACILRATYRFAMTGTPMMNSVEELFSLLQFLRIKPYCQWDRFRSDFVTPLKSNNDRVKQNAMKTLQVLCKATMLRRTKKSTFEGQPILVLPERTTDMEHPVFDDEEMAFYQALETQSQLQFNKYLKRGTVGTHYSAVLVLLLRLRQACCHPHLIKDFGVSAAADLTTDQMLDFARQLRPDVVNRIKATEGNFECPVCYDAVANPAIFIPCGHDTCSECFAKIADPANAIQNGDESGRAKCPNCRGTIDPKQLTDFASFKRVHMPELLTAAERQIDDADEDVSDTESDSDSETEDDDVESETESLSGFIADDDEDLEAEAANNRRLKQKIKDEAMNDDDDDDDTDDDLNDTKRIKADPSENAGPSTDNSAYDSERKVKINGSGKEPAVDKKKKKKGKSKKKDKGKGKEKKKVKPQMTLAELKKMANRNVKARKAYLRRLRKDWVSSAKIDKTMDLLNEIMAVPEGEKVLIFSQWTSLLDLLEIPIDNAGFGYRRYDGSMSAKMRGDAVDDFTDRSKNVRIMLISLKAGNAGLNLNMASQVIILDPFWNPYIEEQAIDRAHRIGQTRPVKVHRVLIEGTVEDRIIALQEKKRALISQALDEKEGSALARLGVQELAYLFGVTTNPNQAIARR